jgi:hypothetical protein
MSAPFEDLCQSIYGDKVFAFVNLEDVSHSAFGSQVSWRYNSSKFSSDW